MSMSTQPNRTTPSGVKPIPSTGQDRTDPAAISVQQPTLPPTASISPQRTDTPTSAISSQSLPEAGRFVPNKVEKSWILFQLIALGAPLQKLRTFEKTCSIVASNARSRHITDAALVEEQSQYGMSWRRTYMARTTTANIVYIASRAVKLAKNVPIAVREADSDGRPEAAVRAGCKEGGVEELLDQALLDYKYDSSKRTQTTEERAAKSIARSQESRQEKRERIEQRKEQYAEVKKRKQEERSRKEQQKAARDLQNAKALTLVANAAAVSAEL